MLTLERNSLLRVAQGERVYLYALTQFHSEWPKLGGVLAILRAIGLKISSRTFTSKYCRDVRIFDANNMGNLENLTYSYMDYGFIFKGGKLTCFFTLLSFSLNIV